LAVVLAVLGLAYLNSPIWHSYYYVARAGLYVFPLAYGFGYLLVKIRKNPEPELIGPAWRYLTAGFIRLASLVAVCYVSWSGASDMASETVYVDNFSNHDVVVYVDGREWLTLPQGTTAKTGLRIGEREWTVREANSGRELDRKVVEVKQEGPYLLNVLGAQWYEKGTVHYSLVPTFGSPPTKPPIISEVWYRIGKVDYVFQPAPGSVKVHHSKGEMPPFHTTGTYFIRASEDAKLAKQAELAKLNSVLN
jgi:hypothetical protein